MLRRTKQRQQCSDYVLYRPHGILYCTIRVFVISELSQNYCKNKLLLELAIRRGIDSNQQAASSKQRERAAKKCSQGIHLNCFKLLPQYTFFVNFGAVKW